MFFFPEVPKQKRELFPEGTFGILPRQGDLMKKINKLINK